MSSNVVKRVIGEYLTNESVNEVFTINPDIAGDSFRERLMKE